MSIILDGSNLTTGGLINAGTAQASTSGTSITFTGIPSTAKRITVMFNGVSTNNSNTIGIQLGTSSGIVTTGYLSGLSRIDSTGSAAFGSATTYFYAATVASAADTQNGSIVFTNITGNTWICQGVMYRSGSNGAVGMTAGSISLSSALTTVSITTSTGTDTFDAGSINILYE